MIYDFHTHSFLSDGELLPMELIRRCMVNGYTAMAITDHVSASTVERVVDEVSRDCEMAKRLWGFDVLPGVEITHVPASGIAEVAQRATQCGALIVVVHGETVVEPVEPGTNRAAVECPDVDILAHPGLLSYDEAKIAAANGTYLEISCRKGHCLTNGHVAKLARDAGARLIVNTDGHAPGDLLGGNFASIVARGAGLTDAEVDAASYQNPEKLLERAAASAHR